MPIYEYKCSKCNKNIEEEFRLGQAPKTVNCEKCGNKCNRVFSPPTIKFVGPGFYVNDSKAEQKKK